MQIYSTNGTRLNYLFINVDDLSQETARMDDYEELVYIRLFFHYLNKQALPADPEKLRRIVRLRHASDVQAKDAVEAFLALEGVEPIEEEPGTVKYVLWDAIIADTVQRFDKKSASGKNAADARWGNHSEEKDAAAA